MKKISILLAGAVLATVLTGCASQPVKPIESNDDTLTLTKEEERVWGMARDLDKGIFNSKQIYRAPEFEAYLAELMDKLFPETADSMQIRVINSPELNAFALPNGSIYLNIGIIARAENEAQLATVLAHEAGHFLQKHGVQQMRNVKSSSAFAVGVALVGIPLVGDLLAVSSIYGFSRDHERESDRIAFETLKANQYDLNETYKVFEHMRDEVIALDIDEPYFFASHPKLQERIDTFKGLIEESGAGEGYKGEEEFNKVTYQIKVDAMALDIKLHRYKSVLLALENGYGGRKLLAHHRYFFSGEALRQRNEDGDLKEAEQAYKNAISANSEYAPPHRALGLIKFKEKEYTAAKDYFSKYLVLAPASQHAAFIKHYINAIEKETGTQK